MEQERRAIEEAGQTLAWELDSLFARNRELQVLEASCQEMAELRSHPQVSGAPSRATFSWGT